MRELETDRAVDVAAFLSAGAVAAGVGGWPVGAKDLATVKERAEFLKDAALTSNV
jgi:hypothetical protein